LKPKTVALVLLVGALILAAAAVSPWLLASVDFGISDWARVGNIGQAYGAASSILSALALAGVSVSVALQARQNHAARVQADKQMRVMLTKLAMADPDLSAVWWDGVRSDSDVDRKRMLFADLMLLQWQMAWEVGELPEASLQEHAAEKFRNVEAVRRFWSQVRLHRTNMRHSSSDDRFSKIIDQSFIAVGALSDVSDARKVPPRSADPTKEASPSRLPSQAARPGSAASSTTEEANG
jgi:hypothetical protein